MNEKNFFLSYSAFETRAMGLILSHKNVPTSSLKFMVKTATRDENRGTHGELFKSIMNFNFTVDLSNNCHGISDQMKIKFSGDDL